MGKFIEPVLQARSQQVKYDLDLRLHPAQGWTEGQLLAGGEERLLPVPLVEESWGMFKCGTGSLKGSFTTGETNDKVLWFLSSTNGVCFLLHE